VLRLTQSNSGSYEEWFKYHSDHVVLALDYLVTSLDDRSLASEAALALKSLCDICRGNLTAHVASFGQLHGKVASMGVSYVSTSN